MKVFDNIISKKDQKFIKNNLLDNGNFPWSYVSDVSKKGNTHQRRPGFKHIFKNYNLIEPILVNTRAKLNKVLYAKDEILEARSFLQLPLNLTDRSIDAPHVDADIDHMVVLYYVNDSDGDTVIYENLFEGYDKVPLLKDLKEKKRVTPKAGRVVLFNGKHWHTSCQPEHNVRCVVNYNVV